MKLICLTLLLCSISYAQNWNTNFDIAKELAKKENKKILLVFSGSDWCAPCIKLDKKVWQSEEFKKVANDWILLKADFPNKKANQLSAEQTTHNKKLAEKYNKDGNFPLVLLIDSNGKTIGITGFKNIDAVSYIEHIRSLDKK